MAEPKGSGVFEAMAGQSGRAHSQADATRTLLFGLFLLGFVFAAGWALRLDDIPMSGGVLLLGVLGGWLWRPPAEKHPVSLGVDLFLLTVALDEMGVL